MGLIRLLAVGLTLFLAAPASAQNAPATSTQTVESATSPWLDLPEVLLSERAVATCSIGAILGMGAALMTSVVDVGVTFGVELLFGGALIGCGAWLGEVAAEQFQWRWEQEHGRSGSAPGEAVRREKGSGPAVAGGLPAQP